MSVDCTSPMQWRREATGALVRTPHVPQGNSGCSQRGGEMKDRGGGQEKTITVWPGGEGTVHMPHEVRLQMGAAGAKTWHEGVVGEGGEQL